MLKQIYSGREIKLPEGYIINKRVSPAYNNETGEFMIICSRAEEIFDENGELIEIKNNYRLLTADKDLNITAECELDLGRDDKGFSLNIDDCIMIDGVLYFITKADLWAETPTFYLCSYNPADKTIKKSQSLAGLFQTAQPVVFRIKEMVCDTDGMIYLLADEEVAVVDTDFTKQYSIKSNKFIHSLAAALDGRVYVTSYFSTEEFGMAEIDKVKKEFGAPVSLEDSSNIYFGEGFDLYTVNNDGVIGMTMDETGQKYKSVMLMNFLNSDVKSSNFNILQIIDSETFLVAELDETTLDYSLALYKKSDNIDLSKAAVIDIANANPYIPKDFNSWIIKFNKANRGKARIQLTDYGQFAENSSTKLAADIVSGIYKPDIIFSTYGNATLRDAIIDRGLFVDLKPLIENDGDLFGCVKRAYSTSDGKMWGICGGFKTQTLLGKTELLGGRTSWTLDEFLDYTETLPADKTISDDFVRESFLSPNFSLFYEQFVDMENYTCDFSNPIFIRLLKFISSLPTGEEKQNSKSSSKNRYENYQTGKSVLYTLNIYNSSGILESECVFLTKDTTMIGFPADNDSGISGIINGINEFIITSYCKDVASAWEFVKSYVAREYSGRFQESRTGSGIPAFKSCYDMMCKEYYRYEYTLLFNGNGGWGIYDPENPRDASSLSSPGIITYLHEEDTAVLKDYLDNSAGIVIKTKIPNDVMDIISEEISYYNGGAKTAEECADVIQSRAKIWLAEHDN